MLLVDNRLKDPVPEIDVEESIKISKKELLVLKILVGLGLVSILNLLLWISDKERIGNTIIYSLFIISIIYKLIRVLHEWYHYWGIKVTPKPATTRLWSVDMFTTAMPGEPFEMIERTLKAMKEVRYPHTTYLCDEGNDPALIQLCQKLDVVHVTRDIRLNAKAGNINNALKQAKGELCVIMDPDHVPVPSYLDEVIGYFEDPEIGYVQMVQAYYNTEESFFSRAAAQQTYLFYGPMMMGMNGYGTVQAIGANCTFRRAALDSIGGHAPGLSEDMHTAMKLHAEGWKSVYTPKILTKGLVPNTLASYCKQQIKWSRGTFDLLFHVYPKLFKNFTWRQKLHYLLLPLHYAFGLIVLLDMIIPLASLVTGEVPIYIQWYQFILVLLPYVGLTTLIRQYAQRWLLEDHERGFHISGGILLFASWWVFTLGFIYTIFNINVPYIATPKNDQAQNNWRLSLPNIIVCILSLGALIYGLQRDWSPYSWMMGGYIGVNILLLAVVIMAAQPVLLKQIRHIIGYFRGAYVFTTATIRLIRKIILPDTYRLLRTTAPALACVIFIICNSFILLDYNPTRHLDLLYGPQIKSTGGFYVGIHLPNEQQEKSLASINAFQSEIGAKMHIVSIYQKWDKDLIRKYPHKSLQAILKRGSIPMITWQLPVSDSLGLGKSSKQQVLQAIKCGDFDKAIKEYAGKIREFNHPVFIRFAPEADKPEAFGVTQPNEGAAEFKEAYQYLVSTFVQEGVNNVSWIWHPHDPKNFSAYYPGENYVDWIGLTCLNYGTAAKDGKWRTFEELYKPFRNEVLKLNKPVMLAEFGSTNYGGRALEWYQNYLPLINNYYKEIRSLVFYTTDRDSNWPSSWRPSSDVSHIRWSIKKPFIIREAFSGIAKEAFEWIPLTLEQKTLKPNFAQSFKKKRDAYLKGSAGQFNLYVDGKPFYIKGVAYNPGHDWRDGNYPLTRKQLEQDFEAIKAMGANTIRRYSPGLYDHNILAVAEEKKIKVLYGFWFDPKVDYYKDTLQVKKYLQTVEEAVSSFKNSSAVLGWSIGNETSSLLKKSFNQPYLSLNRKAYMQMIELMAERIHQLDPNRPVFTSLEHSRQLAGEIMSFNKLVPSVDIVGINSYYTQQIGKLQNIVYRLDTTRPYIISEFGPSGYWDPEYSNTDKNHQLIEESDSEKSKLYTSEWSSFIQKYKGYNIGGVAFCWKDRFEGTATWFGLTDYRGRKKPSYYALQKVWSSKSSEGSNLKANIVGPWGYLLPDKPYTFTVVTKGGSYTKIEWSLYKDEYLQEMKVTNVNDQNNKIVVKIPNGTHNCRLYVYVYDSKGNVTTSSKAIML